ncbi:MAG: polymer-forming cytoskeletal protein [Gammaproteobacteria bacterium]|nr:polymer-forming cytoskeletal protein [Gammaproteobacteria bacterium]MCP5137599.1 polymer-forming cytoskeletal protein [Gammaproteobacteria bacterium]
MFGKDKKPKPTKIDTLIGRQTELRGDILFSGGLHVDGTIKGNVIAEAGSASVLTLSEHGVIEGEVRVPHIILNGTVVGDVHASETIEFDPKASVTGNVYYKIIEMAMGAEVNGSLVRRNEPEAPVLSLPRENAAPAPSATEWVEEN